MASGASNGFFPVALIVRLAVDSVCGGECPVALTLVENRKLGDFKLACLPLAGASNAPPREVVQAVGTSLRALRDVTGVRTIPPYVYFRVSDALLVKTAIEEVCAAGERYGESDRLRGRTIVVGYASPNVNKPLHLGHLRNICIGASVANLLEAAGARVIRDALVSDVGVHVCKAIAAYERWGKGETPASTREKGDHFVGQYYRLACTEEDPRLAARTRELLASWWRADPVTVDLWSKVVGWVEEGFRETYERVKARFEMVVHESDLYPLAYRLIERGLREGVFRRTPDGAVVYDTRVSGRTPTIVARSDGTPLNLIVQVAGTVSVLENPSIDGLMATLGDEWEEGVTLHDAILAALGYPLEAAKCAPLYHGMVYYKSAKMKSREGEVITIDELMDSLEVIARDDIDRTSGRIGLDRNAGEAEAWVDTMIKFYVLSRNVRRPIHFNLERLVSHAENAGVLVHQIRKCLRHDLGGDPSPERGGVDCALLCDVREREIASTILAFPRAVESAVSRREPAVLARYVVRLARALGRIRYPYCRDPRSIEEERVARRALAGVALVVLEKGLQLLNVRGFDTPRVSQLSQLASE